MTEGRTPQAFSRRLGLSRALPLVVLAIGLLATLAGGLLVARVLHAQEQERFQAAIEQAQQAIIVRMDTYAAVLRAGAGLAAAEDAVIARPHFHAFAEQLDLPRYYPGIQGLGYSVVLPALEGPATRALLARFEAPDLQVRPSYPRPEVHAIVELEPMDRRNRAALGYDMFSEPVRRAAMQHARDSGGTAISGKVQLVQEIDREKQAGFLMYQPVYRGGTAPATAAARRTELAGFIYAPFRADDLLNGVFGRGRRNLDIAVYDGAARPENLLHKSFAGTPEAMARLAPLSELRAMDLAGKRWVVAYYARPELGVGAGHRLLVAFMAGGLVATLLVAAGSWWQLRARLAAEAEIAARKRADAQRQLLVGELNHRVKNTLATVQSVAAQTLREGKTLRETREDFESRLLALSQTHNLLTRDYWNGASLHELVAIELAPYAGLAAEQRVDAQGENLVLPADLALGLGMSLHELATNAAKYGALSAPEGQVIIRWETRQQKDGPSLRLCWRETGGPPVAQPERRGFGTRLIVSGLRRQFGAEVELVFETTGVRCTIELRLEAPVSPINPAAMGG